MRTCDSNMERGKSGEFMGWTGGGTQEENRQYIHNHTRATWAHVNNEHGQLRMDSVSVAGQGSFTQLVDFEANYLFDGACKSLA